MTQDITANELSDKLLELAKKEYNDDMKYPFLFGTMTGLLEASRWGFKPVQQIINERFAEAEKQLAAH